MAVGVVQSEAESVVRSAAAEATVAVAVAAEATPEAATAATAALLRPLLVPYRHLTSRCPTAKQPAHQRSLVGLHP